MIVLTGGAGFIGSAFLRKLNAEGINDVLVVDHLGQAEKWKNLVSKSFRTMIDKDAFLYGMEQGSFDEGIDCIIHLGACTNTTERDADYLFENNYHYSVKLAVHCLNHDIRFIYASSAATYGMGECGYSDSVFDPLRPMNMYGFSKHIFDLWVRQNGCEDRFAGLKFFNVFGPNEYHKDSMASMVYKSFQQIQEHGRVKLFRSTVPEYADGEQKRDFIYVKDVIEVLWKLYKEPSVNGIFNLGTGTARSWNDLVAAVFDAMDRERVVDYVDMPASLKDQYQNFTQADMTKLNSTAAAHQCQSLEDSVRDYVREYLLRPWKYM